MPKIIKELCPQNHVCPCINICPVNAIKQKGFELPEINKEICINCNKCIIFCPRNAIQKDS